MTILITGATDGIGLQTALQLARQGKELVLHGRSEEKVRQARDTVLHAVPHARLQIAYADLADLDEVSHMADELKARLTRLDVLVNNAGVYMTERRLSKQGFEMTLAVNHLAHFLLTLSLFPLLKRAQEPRVVTVSSVAHMSGRIDLDDMNCAHHFDAYQAYADSKLANALFAAELARREPWLSSNSLHPGVIDTKLLHTGFKMQGASVVSGASTSVYLAVSPEVKGVTGRYFDAAVAVAPSPWVSDRDIAQRLWVWSERAVQNHLPLSD